jgi:hypothetical protein
MKKLLPILLIMSSTSVMADTVECTTASYMETKYELTKIINDMVNNREVKHIVLGNDKGTTDERLICVVFE